MRPAAPQAWSPSVSKRGRAAVDPAVVGSNHVVEEATGLGIAHVAESLPVAVGDEHARPQVFSVRSSSPSPSLSGWRSKMRRSASET